MDWWIRAAGLAALGLGLAVICWTDWRERLIPDVVVGPLALIGLALAVLAPIGPAGPVAAALGAGALGGAALAIRTGGGALYGREAFGWGDVKFLAMAGAWVGAPAGVFLFGSAALVGSALYGLETALRRLAGRRPRRTVGAGPGLCAALALVVAFDAAGDPVGLAGPLSFMRAMSRAISGWL